MTRKDDEAQELSDIMKEESTRGRRHPKRALTASQERKMRQFASVVSHN
jgi:hypothetical protein